MIDEALAYGAKLATHEPAEMAAPIGVSMERQNNLRFIEASSPATRQGMEAWIRKLPLGHLQLGGIVARERSTIGDLLDAVANGALTRSSALAAKRMSQIAETLKAISEQPQEWDRFRRRRPLFRSYKAIYFGSPRFLILNTAEKRSRLAKLHLSQRAINTLNAAKITNIGQLVTRAERGLINVGGLGKFKLTG